MSKTKDKIVEKALNLYNIHGIEYVGVRELAKELEMKGGNITYYFPTKADLIAEIQIRLSNSNSELFASERETSIYNFLKLHFEIYQNQYKYRSIFVSLPLLLKQGSIDMQIYKDKQYKRKKDLYDEMKHLFMKGYFQTAKSDDMDTVLNTVILNNRMWIAEATADGIIEDQESAIITYIERLAGIIKIVASDKGREEIARFMKEIKKEAE